MSVLDRDIARFYKLVDFTGNSRAYKEKVIDALNWLHAQPVIDAFL